MQDPSVAALSREDTRRLYDDALVWDMVFNYEPEMGNGANLFDRYIAAGVNFISVHPAGDRHNAGEALKRIARCRAEIERVVGEWTAARSRAEIVAQLRAAGVPCGSVNDVAEAVTRSALERRESRGGHFREDFPNKDGEWGQWNVRIARGSDGAMQLTRVAIPELPPALRRIITENE